MFLHLGLDIFHMYFFFWPMVCELRLQLRELRLQALDLQIPAEQFGLALTQQGLLQPRATVSVRPGPGLSSSSPSSSSSPPSSSSSSSIGFCGFWGSVHMRKELATITNHDSCGFLFARCSKPLLLNLMKRTPSLPRLSSWKLLSFLS